MDGTPGSGHSTGAALWAACAVPVLGAALAVCGALLAEGVRESGAAQPEVLVGLAAAALGGAVVLGWGLAAGIAVLAVVSAHRRWGRLARLCRRFSPALLRRAAATVLGLQLVGLPAASAEQAVSPFWGGDDRTPVHASPYPPSGPGPAGPAPVDPPPAAPAPSDPPPATPGAPDISAPLPPPSAPPLSRRTVEGSVTVLRGDTLWSLAAAQLGPGATDAQIARCWPVWYELNRHVLRDGPHLLLPGQRLVVPAAGHAAVSPSSTSSQPIPGGPS